jgi:hypothetical protein
MKYAKFTITYAELILEGIELPYTTNDIERLMWKYPKDANTNRCTALPTKTSIPETIDEKHNIHYYKNRTTLTHN